MLIKNFFKKYKIKLLDAFIYLLLIKIFYLQKCKYNLYFLIYLSNLIRVFDDFFLINLVI